MKTLLRFTLCLAILVLPLAPAFADIRLVDDGKPAATIVIADRPVDVPLRIKANKYNPELEQDIQHTQKYAAEELQRYLQKATGAQLAIAPAGKAPKEGVVVLVGRSALSDSLGLKPSGDPEGFRIVAFEKGGLRGIAILGEIAPEGTHGRAAPIDRGTLHGVYRLLDDLGFRFYFYEEGEPEELGVVIPSMKTVALPEDLSIEDAPDFQNRTGFVTGTWANPDHILRVNRIGSSTGFYANHTDQAWGRDFRKKHPTAFLLHEDGTRDHEQPCYSDPETMKIRLDLLEGFYRDGSWAGGHRKPRPKVIPFVIIDNYHTPCRCRRCMADYRPEWGRYGRISEIIFEHTVELAEHARKRWPDKRINTLAYSHYMLPPTMDIPDNVDIRVAMMWSTKINKEPYWYARNLRLLKDWSKKVDGERARLSCWAYGCWPGGNKPYLFPHTQKRWLTEVKDLINGEFINSGQPTPVGYYMNYVWTRLLWDTDTDVDALLDDHCSRFFGPAAGPMKAFYTLLIDRWENVQWSVEIPTWYIPDDLYYGETYTAPVLAQLRKHLADAKRAAGENTKGNIYARRVAWLTEGYEPFLSRGELAHKYLGRVVTCTAPAVDDVPEDAAAWRNVPGGTLETDGDGEYATRWAMVRAGDRIHLWFEAREPTRPRRGDSVTVSFHPDFDVDSRPITTVRDHIEIERKFPQGVYKPEPKNNPTIVIHHNGLCDGNLDAALESTTFEDGLWRTHVSFPAANLWLYYDRADSIAAQVERVRDVRPAEHKGPPRRDKRGRLVKPKPQRWLWVPQLVPEWPEYPPRLGKVIFEARGE